MLITPFVSLLLLLNNISIAQIQKNPGVYVEEVSSKPLSVAQVETAIPAFIGYTEIASRDLLFVPVKVSSFLEYERTFGVGATTEKFVLYPSLKLYFVNGGSPCYIVSVGPYKNLQKGNFINGLAAIGKVDEVTLLVFPDAVNLPGNDLYEVQKEALLQAASLKDRFCILDLKAATTNAEHSASVNEFRNNIGNNNLKYGAAYSPFLKISNSASIPPSAIVAGQYCAVDKSKGVWKAPANVTMKGVNDIAYAISESEQAGLSVDAVAGKSINAIRRFTGKGILIWGSRTLAGNDNEWRYVPVRRFFIMVEESIKKSLQPFVFEPNDANTWVKVKTMIQNYLTTKWRDGALSGSKPEHAYFVKVGLGETMTQQDMLNKKMIIEIGMAPVRPAEFIITRIVMNVK
ncbi:MAG: phage tail sheath family protein [Chitinophagaceae bacterium]|nr:phage tail sheath family protein [Chitinophagaceae bacterium]